MFFTIIFVGVEITIRIEEIADEVNELKGLADFACNGPDLKDYEGIVGLISYSFLDMETSEAIGFRQRERTKGSQRRRKRGKNVFNAV